MKPEFTHNGQILLNDPKQVFVPRTGTIPVFLDLDGTMFKFRKDGESYKDIHGRDRNFHFEDLWEEGYYRLLPPIREMVDAVNQLHDQEAFIIVDGKAVPIEFNILSAVLTDSNYAFNDLPSEITSQKEGKEIRMELDKIRDNFEKVNSRMLDYFEMSSKEKNKTVPER